MDALPPDFWPRLALAVPAVWRLTHLLAREDGPFDLVARARATLGAGAWGRMFDCFHCLSLWVAAPLAPWLADGWTGIAVAWLALSGAACLCERWGGAPEVVLQPLPELAGHAVDDPDGQCRGQGRHDKEGDRDGMLRTTP